MPGAIAQTGAAGDALKKLIAEHHCLAEAMYFEARGEGEAGMRAVADVILHRLAEGSHGATICSVVYEGADLTFCQFTFACDGALDQPRLPEAWRAAQVLAARLLAGEGPGSDNTDGATYFHTVSVHPTWAPKMERVTQIGNHIFYRAKAAAISVAFRAPLQ
ncbi:MAG TPA: cell wall hydrolase [Rhizomicrobium sp.]|nr:cell wall hydrolase [Rhizomicrobium sp.]